MRSEHIDPLLEFLAVQVVDLRRAASEEKQCICKFSVALLDLDCAFLNEISEWHDARTCAKHHDWRFLWIGC